MTTVYSDFEGRMDGVIPMCDSDTVNGRIIKGKELGITIPFALKPVEYWLEAIMQIELIQVLVSTIKLGDQL